MRVAEPAKARSALTWLGVLFFVEVGLTVVSLVVTQALSSADNFEAITGWFKLQPLLWLPVSAGFVFSLFTLTRSLEEPDLAWGVTGAAALSLGLELYWAAISLTAGEGEPLAFSQTLSVLSIAASMLAVLGCCVLIGRLGRSTGFAAAIGAFLVVRSGISLAAALRVGDEHLPIWTYHLRTVISLACIVGLGALALHARRALEGASLGAPRPGEAAQLPPITEASGMRQVITGVVLLMLGIGGTALSYAAASSGSGGGRYIIATGAIATGLVQLVRGLTRLGR